MILKYLSLLSHGNNGIGVKGSGIKSLAQPGSTSVEGRSWEAKYAGRRTEEGVDHADRQAVPQ